MVRGLWENYFEDDFMDRSIIFEPFNGNNNFSIWLRPAEDVLIQQGLLHKTLQGKKPKRKTDEEMERIQNKTCRYYSISYMSPNLLYHEIE